MKALRTLLVGATLALASQWLSAQEEASFPGIEALMTEQEFREAGLDKLTPVERGALDRWLIRYTAEDAPVLLSTDEEVRKAVAEQEIVSTILPPFAGWNGNTVFKLANGQVWQQRRRGSYSYQGPDNPQVKISRNFMGFYRLELLESGRAVQVKRLR